MKRVTIKTSGTNHYIYYFENIIAYISESKIEIYPQNYPFGYRTFSKLLSNKISEILYKVHITIKNGDYVYTDYRNREITFTKSKESFQVYIGK